MTEELVFRIVFILLQVALLALNSYFILKSRRSEEKVSRGERWNAIVRYEGKLLVALRGLLAPVWLVAIVFYAIYPDWMAGLALPLPEWLRWGGVALSLAAIAANTWAQATLGREYSRILRVREGQRLIESGPYRWIRHPIYLGGSLFFLGILLESANSLVAASMVFSIAMLLVRIPREEAMMLERFGDAYREYMKRTGRVLPRWR
jgi:protein-S-isoprenylcysteine O-methyltransferase Ste14